MLACGGAADEPELTETSDVARETVAEGAESHRRLELADGQIVSLPTKPERIVSLVLAADDVLLEIVDPSRVLALSALSTDPRYSLTSQAAEAFGTTVPSQAEPILALRPDLVFAAGYTTAETLEQLERAGAPVLRLSQYDSLDEIRANIRLIGQAVGESERAETLVRRLDGDLEAARDRSPRNAPLRVLGWWSGSVLGAETLLDDVIGELGAINVAAEAGLRGWPRVSLESIVAWAPDVVLVDMELGAEAAVEQLRSEPVIARSGLVDRGAIVAVPSAAVSSVSHHIGRFSLGLAQLLADAEAGRPLEWRMPEPEDRSTL